jgi:hypothetical protein
VNTAAPNPRPAATTPAAGLAPHVICALLLLAFAGLFAQPLWDSDFWWHVAAGRIVANDLTLPQGDPFGVFEASGVRVDTVLRGQWLGQLALYFVFDRFGVDGVIVFRTALLVACLAAVYLRCLRLGAGAPLALLMLLISGATLVLFTGERPQLLSFLLGSLALLLLDEYRVGGRRQALLAVPLVVLVWANTHGAMLLGGLVLALHAAGELLRARLAPGARPGPDRALVLAATVAVACTLLSPNGIQTHLYLLQLEGSELQQRTSEYVSPLLAWKQLQMPLPFYWTLLLLALATLPECLRRARFGDALVVMALGAISLGGLRYVPFFVLLASPYVALAARQQLERLKAPPQLAWALAVIAGGAVLLARPGPGGFFERGLAPRRFPEAAIAALEESGARGRVFSSLEWGGFVLWHLQPEVVPFVDGRMLDPRKLVPYTHILWTTPEGIAFFSRGRFDFVLIPRANRFSGETYPLNGYLLGHPGWRVLHEDELGYLFARRSPASGSSAAP